MFRYCLLIACVFSPLFNPLNAMSPETLERALMTTPSTAIKVDTIYKSGFNETIVQCQVAPGHCDEVITGDFINRDYIGQDMSGKRICLTNHILVYIRNLNGSDGDPAIISNCGGLSSVTTDNKALWLRGSRYVRITGTGHPGIPIGLKFTGAHNTIDVTQGSSDVEIDHVEVAGLYLSQGSSTIGTGIAMRTYPECIDQTLEFTRPGFTQYNSVIRDSYIHNIRSEGLYIGTSHHNRPNGYMPEDCDGDGNFENTPQANLEGVRVERNILEFIGGDGIQVGANLNNGIVKDNLVFNFGIEGDAPHIHGFEINPGSLLEVSNNWIQTQYPDESGVGISIQGAGGSRFINNVFVGMHDGIMGLRSTGPTNDPHVIWHNTFILSGVGNAADMWCNTSATEVATNQFDYANNLFVNSQMPWYDRQFGTSDCWVENAQWFSSDVMALGLADPANGLYWPVSGSPLIDQGALTNPSVDMDFFDDNRVTIEPGAFSAQ